MYRFSFVILHYLAYESTCACVDSIMQAYAQSSEMPYHIIIVDNASPNDSYQRLLLRYKQNPNIHFIHSADNVGFAKGNNLGYLYAVNELHSDFVIIANNDTEFHQHDFLAKTISIYEKNLCGLLGPDIVTPAGLHQNPYRTHIITNKELRLWIRNRRLWLIFLNLDKVFHLSKHIPFFREYYSTRALAGKPNTSWKNAAENIVLQGACIIFTPTFINTFPQYAFYPDTFMYCEEDIIAYLCQKNGIKTCYAPSLQIQHLEAVSTQLSHASQLQKDLFLTSNILKSLKIYKKLRKSYSE